MAEKKEKIIDFFAADKAEEKSEETSSKNEDDAIVFSCKVVDLLKAKMKNHNKAFPKAKVALSDLKTVYRHGATMSEGSETLGEKALARVNLYMRMKIGHSEAGFKNLLSQVDLKDSLNYLKNSSIDISNSLLPSEEDFLLAKEEIKEWDLDYDFKDINELYLDNYEKDSWKWQW